MATVAHTSLPIACVPQAIPAAERSAHFALARRLFTLDALSCDPLENGYAFSFPAEKLGDVARFVGNERKCCRFMRFEIDIEPGDATLRLRMTGPEGTRAVLDAELNLSGCESACGCQR